MVTTLDKLEVGDKFHTPAGRYTFKITSIGRRNISFEAIQAVGLKFTIPVSTAAIFHVTTAN